MRTFLKFLIILLAIIAIGALILMAVSPKKMVLTESDTMEAPPTVIYNIVNDFKKWEEWSPWAEMDPNAVNTYSKKTEGKGATWGWKGNKDVGEGFQTITESVPYESINTALKFNGFDGESKSNWTFEKEGEKTKVTWDFDGAETPFVFRPFNLLMKGKLKKTYKQGLANIRQIVEERAKNKNYNGFVINEIYVGEKNYVMNRQQVSMENITQFYAQNLGALFTKAQGAELEMDGMPSGLFYSWNQSNGTTDMAAAIPTKTPANIPGFISQTLPDGKAVQVDYYGDYSKTEAAHNAIDAYLKDHGLLVNYPVIEEYVTDPTTEKDPSKWLTKITYYTINSTQ